MNNRTRAIAVLAAVMMVTSVLSPAVVATAGRPAADASTPASQPSAERLQSDGHVDAGSSTGSASTPAKDGGQVVESGTQSVASGAQAVTSVNVSGVVEYWNGTAASKDLLLFDGPNGTVTNLTDVLGRYGVTLEDGTVYEVTYQQDNPFSTNDTAFPKDGVVDVYAYGEESYSGSQTGANRTVPQGHVLNVTVVDEDGTPVSGASVSVVHEQNGASAFFSAPTNANGLMVHSESDGAGVEVNGTVDVFVNPPNGSGLSTNYTTVTVSGDRTEQLTLYPASNVTGSVTYANGSAAKNTTVAFFGKNADTAQVVVTGETGGFNTTLRDNVTYEVGFWQTHFDPDDTNPSFPRDGAPDFLSLGTVNSSTDTTLNYGLPAASVLNVTVENRSGSPIENATVGLLSTNGTANFDFYSFTEAMGPRTDALGRMVHQPNGIAGVETAGDVSVYVEPPSGSGYQNNSTSVTVSGSTNETVVLRQADVTVSGTVTEADGSPAVNQTLGFHAGNDSKGTLISSDGTYSVGLQSGVEYAVTYSQRTPTDETDVDFPTDGSADFFALGNSTFNESTTLDFQAPVGHDLDVKVVDQNGNPISNATVFVDHQNGGARIGMGAPTNASGVLVHPESDSSGFEVNGTVAIHVDPPNDNYTGNSTTVTVSSDRTVTLVLRETATITGTAGFVWGDTPASNETVVASGPTFSENRTDSSGHFVLPGVDPTGTYNVSLYQLLGNDTLRPHDGNPDLYSLGKVVEPNGTVDMGNVYIPTADVLNVTVVDGNGTAVEGAGVVVIHHNPDVNASAGWRMHTRPDGMIAPSGQDTGIEVYGQVTVIVLPPRNSTEFVPEKHVRNLSMTSGPQDVVVSINRTETTPSSLDFGTVAVGDTKLLTVNLTNTGEKPLAVAGTSMTGANPGAFAVDSGGGAFELAPGETRTVTVAFTPGGSGGKNASLRFENPTPSDGPALEVPLSGTGDGDGGSGGAELLVTPTAVSFEDVYPGDTATTTVTLANSGGGILNISSVTVEGADASAFSASGGTSQLAGGETTTVTVTFAPQTAGSKSASLAVQSNAGSATVSLSGTAQADPDVSISPGSLAFGNVQTGTQATMSFTVQNTGNGTLTLDAGSLSGSGAFRLLSSVPSELDAGQSASVTVAFTPNETGSHQGSLTVETNDPDVPSTTVSFTGEGVDSDLSVSPTSLDFGKVSVGSNATTSVTVTNDGSTTVSLTQVAAVGEGSEFFSVLGNPTGDLAPGASRQITVRFEAAEAGSHVGRLAIGTDSDQIPALDVALSAKATAPDIVVFPSALDFGVANVSGQATATVTVMNRGSEPLAVNRTTIVGSNPGAFSVGAGSFRLAPGTSRTVTVTFSPGSAGNKSAMLRFASNDPDEPQTNVWLTNTKTVVKIEQEANETADNETDTVTIEARNVEDNSTISMNVSRRDNRDDDVSVDEINMTVEEGGNFSLNVTTSEDELADAPNFTKQQKNGTVPAGFVRVTHSIDDANISRASFKFRMSKDRLSELDAEPDEVALYRYHDGEWVELETTVVGQTSTHVILRATSPGLSDFTSGVKQPKFRLLNARVTVSKITQGDDVQVRVKIRNDGGADGTFTAELLLNGDSVDSKDVTVATGGVRVIVFEREITEPGTYTVKVNGVTAGDVNVTAADVNRTVTGTADPGGQSTSTDVPGFTALGTLLVVVAVLALARRRR